MEDDVLADLDSYSLLPQRVNEPPIIILGCTAMELLLLVSTTFLIWLMILLPVLLSTSYGKPLFSALLLLEGATIYGAGKLFNRMKRSRPRGYYVHFLRVYFEQYGLADSHLFIHSGPMDLGRSKQFISLSSLADVLEEYDELQSENNALDRAYKRAQEIE